MKISVLMITRNRKNDVINTINEYKKQAYKNFEIVLVDNGSTDGLRESMPEMFPEVDYTWLPDNFDIRSLNIAFSRSTGEIIWRGDDDSHPRDYDAFEKIIDIFTKHNDIHVICSEDIEVRKNYSVWNWYPLPVDKENIPEKGYKAHIFPGTGVGIRREVYEKTGGFWEFGFEELDFATRAILNGYNLRYFPNIVVYHHASPGNRPSSWRWTQFARQLIRYQFKYFNFWRACSRSFIYWINLNLEAIYRRLPFSTVIEGNLMMAAAALRARREERVIVPREKYADITLGKSAWGDFFNYMVSAIKNKFRNGKA